VPTSQLSEIKGTGDYKRKPGMEIVRLERQNCGRIGGADSNWVWYPPPLKMMFFAIGVATR
jgi:hypothetical protein